MASPLIVTLHDNLTDKQKLILRSKSKFIRLTGPAGTSKSYIALARGLRLLSKDEISRIVIIRSAVETRKIGFLPGSQQEKLDVYTEPYIHLVNELSPKKSFKALMSSKDIEFHSTSFLRGVTFDDAYIIVDEYQNMSAHELETVVTRVGENTHLTLCGDYEQSDLPSWEAADHQTVIRSLDLMPDFEVHAFGVEDIVRSEFVRRYYAAKALASQDNHLTRVVGMT